MKIKENTMANKTRILFTDIDDTLLNAKKEITPEVDAAIRRALDAGHKIVLSTGRPLAGALPIVRRLHLDTDGCYAITFNGALIWDCGAGKPLYKNTITKEEAAYIFHKAKEAHFHVQTYDSENILTPADDKEVRFYAEKMHMTYKVMPDLPDSIPEDPAKVLMVSLDEHDRLEQFRQDISGWAKGRISVFFSNQWYLEFVREGISKGFAVRYIASHLGVPMENTVAAGDAENDIAMLKAAHIGCAMANATDEVKKAADYVTVRDCEHSGVAEIIDKFIL